MQPRSAQEAQEWLSCNFPHIETAKERRPLTGPENVFKVLSNPLTDKRLDYSARIVAAYLQSVGETTAATEEISTATGVPKRTLLRGTQRMADLGMISRRPLTRGDGGWVFHYTWKG